MQQMQIAGSTGTNEGVSSLSKRNPQEDILQRDGLRDIRTEVNSLTENENGHQEEQGESGVYFDNGAPLRGEVSTDAAPDVSVKSLTSSRRQRRSYQTL